MAFQRNELHSRRRFGGGDMKVKLKAPDGYLYYDALTDRYYSEVITDNRARYTLVPASQKGDK